MTDTANTLKPLMDILGYHFKNTKLLTEALTHSSLTKGRRVRKGQIRDYDRLEFLGDRVLGLVISEELFHRFEDAEAGQLSRRYNMQVRKETLADIARDIGLDDYILLSDDLREAGGLDNPSLLEDCVEAVIAALYLDGGMEAARGFIEKQWWPRLEQTGAASKDPKSALQEWAAKSGKNPPVYCVIAEEGPDHARTFTVQVSVEGCEQQAASALSKRGAEQLAAEKVLKDQDNE